MVVRVFAPRVLRFRCFRSSSRSGGSASPRVVARSSWPERCLARHIAGSSFSCSLEYLLMPFYEHDLTLASSEITNPDTFQQAYLRMLASKYEYENIDRAREVLGIASDD